MTGIALIDNLIDRITSFFEANGDPHEERNRKGLVLVIAAGLFGMLLCLWFYGRVHLYDEYSILHSAQVQDIAGTQYLQMDGSILKISSDGVFCTNLANETKWSVAYSMQTPVADVNGRRAVIGEQQGDQVYVLGKDGLTGNFRTGMSIRKVRIAANGVSVILCEDGDAAWIRMFSAEGGEIAAIKTTVRESGYPLDVAVTPDAKRLMVSYLRPEGNELSGVITFYDFSSASASDEDHLAASYVYERQVFPVVFYASASMPVAVSDTGFTVFEGTKKPSPEKTVELESEIVSMFRDAGNIGFVFHSGQTDQKYLLDVYNYKGNRVMETSLNFEYEDICMADGEILLSDARNLNVYRISGRQKVSVSYDKPVICFGQMSGSKKYFVITTDSMDQISVS